jgi:hypothetical protein
MLRNDLLLSYAGDESVRVEELAHSAVRGLDGDVSSRSSSTTMPPWQTPQPGWWVRWRTSVSSTSRCIPLADSQSAVAEVKREGLIKSTDRTYRQDYVVFLRAVDGKIALLPRVLDPVRAAKALNTPILGL